MKKSNVIGLTVGIVVTIVAVSLISWFAIRPVPTLIQGEVEATDIKISSKLAGRIEQMDVQEGERVKKGQLLFVLSTPEAEAKLQQAEAARMAASAQSTKARKGARVQEIEGAMNIWKKAEAGLELARKSYERVKNLYESGVVPEQKYDEAAANLKAMETTAAAAKAQYDMAIEGARREDREAAEALVKQASGAVSEVESYISDAMQYSPIDGEISTVIAQQGELISAGYPVVTLLDMNDLWVTFNIKEDLLPKIKIGSVLQAYVPGIGRTIELKVYYMAVQAEYATWSATRTKGDFDIRTFGAVMTTFVKASLNCGQVRGPVQLSFAKSVDPIMPQEVTITRVAITTEADAEKKGTEMGRKYIVPYALYRAEGYVSANLARKTTGFSDEDLELLWQAIMNMFEVDHAAARGKMATRELIVFKHDSELGNAPAYKLFDLVKAERREGVDTPRAYSDYNVSVDEAALPSGVECIRI